jgi:hypothetical protein
MQNVSRLEMPHAGTGGCWSLNVCETICVLCECACVQRATKLMIGLSCKCSYAGDWPINSRVLWSRRRWYDDATEEACFTECLSSWKSAWNPQRVYRSADRSWCDVTIINHKRLSSSTWHLRRRTLHLRRRTLQMRSVEMVQQQLESVPPLFQLTIVFGQSPRNSRTGAMIAFAHLFACIYGTSMPKGFEISR